MIDRISEATGQRRAVAKHMVQEFLDTIIDELGKGNRIEFRDFGVFEARMRRERQAQNPKTLERVIVPAKQTVKFKPGRLMKKVLEDGQPEIVTRPMKIADSAEATHSG
ncbi:MAG: HU family DNA-binding protein [Phycisphaerales bacterium]|nr:HU family DNA-binding protein [Phycisphaerales bacterium]